MSWGHLAGVCWFVITCVWAIVSSFLKHGRPTDSAQAVTKAEEADAKVKDLADTVEKSIRQDLNKWMSKNDESEVDKLENKFSTSLIFALGMGFFHLWLAWKVHVTPVAILGVAIIYAIELGVQAYRQSDLKITKAGKVNFFYSAALNLAELGVLWWGGLFLGFF